MRKPDSETDILNRLRQICSKSEKSPKDIQDKLKQWNSECDPLYIIGVLKKEGFLDESRYTMAYVNDKIKFARWGKIKIRYHLKFKSISEGIIDHNLNSFPFDEYRKIIEGEIRKKNSALKESDPFKRKQKLLSFGNQRGFECELLLEIIESLPELS